MRLTQKDNIPGCRCQFKLASIDAYHLIEADEIFFFDQENIGVGVFEEAGDNTYPKVALVSRFSGFPARFSGEEIQPIRINTRIFVRQP